MISYNISNSWLYNAQTTVCLCECVNWRRLNCQGLTTACFILFSRGPAIKTEIIWFNYYERYGNCVFSVKLQIGAPIWYLTPVYFSCLSLAISYAMHLFRYPPPWLYQFLPRRGRSPHIFPWNEYYSIFLSPNSDGNADCCGTKAVKIPFLFYVIE